MPRKLRCLCLCVLSGQVPAAASPRRGVWRDVCLPASLAARARRERRGAASGSACRVCGLCGVCGTWDVGAGVWGRAGARSGCPCGRLCSLSSVFVRACRVSARVRVDESSQRNRIVMQTSVANTPRPCLSCPSQVQLWSASHVPSLHHQPLSARRGSPELASSSSSCLLHVHKVSSGGRSDRQRQADQLPRPPCAPARQRHALP